MMGTTTHDAWNTSLRDAFQETFDGLERALRACPDALWAESLWEVTQRWPIRDGLGAGLPEAERRQSFSAFWFIAWHALVCTHYDIEGGELPEGWGPPPPFNEYIVDRETLPPRVYTRNEIHEYVARTQHRVEEVVGALTDERIARPVAAGHRYAGWPYAKLLLMCLTHTREHVAQLDMFLGQRGVVRA
jgi:hypothetical protein